MFLILLITFIIIIFLYFTSIEKQVYFLPKSGVKQPASNGTKPKGDKPVSKGTKPVSKGTKPVSKGTKPVSKGTKPVSKGTKPVSKGTKPVSKGTKPVSKGTKPVSKGRGAKTKVDYIYTQPFKPVETVYNPPINEKTQKLIDSLNLKLTYKDMVKLLNYKDGYILPKACKNMEDACKSLSGYVKQGVVAIAGTKLVYLNTVSTTPDKVKPATTTIDGKTVYGTFNTISGRFVPGQKPTSLTSFIPNFTIADESNVMKKQDISKLQSDIKKSLIELAKFYNIPTTELKFKIDDAKVAAIKAHAYFDPNDNTIYLSSSSNNDLSLLKHEMFHAASYATGISKKVPLFVQEGLASMVTRNDDRKLCEKTDLSKCIPSMFKGVLDSTLEYMLSNQKDTNIYGYKYDMSKGHSYTTSPAFLEYLNKKIPYSATTLYDRVYRQPQNYSEQIWFDIYGDSLINLFKQFVTDVKTDTYNPTTGEFTHRYNPLTGGYDKI